MNTRLGIERDPLIEEIADAVVQCPTRQLNGEIVAVLVAGPPGFGKTSVLRASVRVAVPRLRADLIWIPGAIVASERHLCRLLSRGPRSQDTAAAHDCLTDVCERIRASSRCVVIAIDDFDVVSFKRASTPEAIGQMIAAADNVRLVATCRPESIDRLTRRGQPFPDAALPRGKIVVHHLSPLDDESALALVRRRAPILSPALAQMVIAEAGGHPAALVFLSRLAALRLEAAPSDLLPFASDFAGAVYAEAWAALGPQQRAIVWQLSHADTPKTAAEIARALEVRSSQISSQLTRLVNEGLVARTPTRGQFTVAPLLARWITRRGDGGHPKTGEPT